MALVTINSTTVRKIWVGLAWCGVALIIFLSLTPSPPDIDLGRFGDKYEHVAAYALLTLWFCQAYLSRVERRWTSLLLIALGIALEFAQRATGLRTFEVADMAAGALGVGVGWLLAPPRLPNLLLLTQSLLARGGGDR